MHGNSPGYFLVNVKGGDDRISKWFAFLSKPKNLSFLLC